MTPRKVAEERLSRLLVDTKDCILCGPVNKDGYPEFQFVRTIDGVRVKTRILVHRLSYELHNGAVLSSNQVVCHTCDTPACVNPRHLFVGSHSDNVQDKVSKNRQAKGSGNGRYKTGFYSRFEPREKPRPKFESLFGRSLTKQQVQEVKQAIASRGEKSLKSLSKELNLSYQLLRDINCGRVYKII